jgi:Winged helix DNA-binding domain
MHGMRRTMFVEPVDFAPVVHAACTRALVAPERKRLVALLEGAAITSSGEQWLRRVEKATLRAIAARGEATAAELGRDVPELREQIPFGEGKKWAGKMGVSTRVLFLLATEGRVVRTRPRGTWTSSQYQWALMEHCVPGIDDVPTEVARVDLARRWLRAFGPATPSDLKWWTGWTGKQAKDVLAGLGAVEVDLDGGTGAVLPDDLAPVAPPEPWLALLPGLDSTVMGWTERQWYLGDYRKLLFDTAGNAGPTIWWNGRVVGGWGQRAGGEVAFRLFEDLGGDVRAAVAAAAEGLGAWLGGTRVIPRFRTPLERELAI